MSEYENIKPILYHFIYDFSEGLAPILIDGKWGFISKNGEMQLPCLYEDALEFSEGLAAVKLNGKYGYIDRAGKEVIPFQYDDAELFSEGMAPVSNEDKYGFVDRSGKLVISYQYDESCYQKCFSEGLAAVALDGKWGYIDKTGREVIPCEYDFACEFSSGLACVELDAKVGYINQSGAIVIPIRYSGEMDASFSGNRVCLQDDETEVWSIIDDKGTILKTLSEYEFVEPFVDGLATVTTLDGKCGCIDTEGQLIIPCEYEMIFLKKDGIVSAKKKGYMGCINHKNEEVMPFIYISIDLMSEGMVLVNDGKRISYVLNQSGNVMFALKKNYSNTNLTMLYIRLAVILGAVGVLIYLLFIR